MKEYYIKYKKIPVMNHLIASSKDGGLVENFYIITTSSAKKAIEKFIKKTSSKLYYTEIESMQKL